MPRRSKRQEHDIFQRVGHHGKFRLCFGFPAIISYFPQNTTKKHAANPLLHSAGISEAISQLCEVSWIFDKDPKRNFTRNRKLPFEKAISFLLAMEGGTLTSELLKHFG
jgi:hypothetical protein